MSQRLFTPGPLTTDIRVREAMTRDWGSRDADFTALTQELRTRLLAVVGVADDAQHVAVPIQGAGTYILEAAVATLIGAEHRLLVAVNGAYGRRMASIARRLGKTATTLEWSEDAAVDAGEIAMALAADRTISHVAIVHCETTTGLLNPLRAVADVVAAAGRVLIVDAMASFGALPIDLSPAIGALLASSNKCLEGPPGLAFALIERQLLEDGADRSPSLSFDLHDQWRGFEANGQWRFTPPVQVVSGLCEALRIHAAEGGAPARLDRYCRRFEMLRSGMAELDYPLYLAPDLQAPIIATFRPRSGRAFDFESLYGHLADRGLVIYPGKLTHDPSFRIGCIGALVDEDFAELLRAIADHDAKASSASSRLDA